MLARDVLALAPADAEVVPQTRTELDATDETAVENAVRAVAPDVIINCAAYTNVDGAESERERAFALNGRAPGILGHVVQRTAHGALTIHFSTDYVFNGRGDRPYREDDATDPVNAYGASKLAGERALAESGAPVLIVRTSWLFGVHGKSFPRTMWRRAQEGIRTRVVNDQVGRPTFTNDLAKAVWHLLRGKRERGREKGGDVLHIANAGTASWYDVARRIFDAAGRLELLTSCSTGDYPTPARRPAYSVLDTSRFEEMVGSLPTWQDAMDRFISASRFPLPSSRSS